ncbi:N-acyl-D-amino-acid deacylase family protein [Agromyces soli]|uniref:Amidohydrolase family protein n=1 Tax=Agromyces soli TaxID=659012 RepID=A0ABY4AVG4_9MICO|nr:amidohydrolase family protein [Agromyces soli]UOE27173.1 amidohydrolase family protein [Agromyces soli]
MTDGSLLVRDARVLAGDELVRADVRIDGERIGELGPVGTLTAPEVLDAGGRLVLPGFVDAHSHADGAVFAEGVQLALLRQGVTSIVIGQDGVSYAPGDGAYAREYFGALLGDHPGYRGGGIAELLAGYDGTSPINVAALAPLGTIRHGVMGDRADAPTARELGAMRDAVAAAMQEGAVGASSGLDYFPGAHASDAELAALLQPVAAVDGVYVTHMRHGYESQVGIGVAEVAGICREARVRGHVSHLHGPLPLVRRALAEASASGVELSFDSYPYARGCTLLAMAVLPAERLSRGPAAALRWLSTRSAQRWLVEEWLPGLGHRPDVGTDWPALLTVAGVERAEDAWVTGLTIRAAAARTGKTPEAFVVRLLAENALNVTAVMAVPSPRPWNVLARIAELPGHVAGSDGIYIGGAPHPRGWSTFTRFFLRKVVQSGEWSVAEAVEHLSARAARRFDLGARGRVARGWTADLVLLDPAALVDAAGYGAPLVSGGVDDVLVGGRLVLRDGRLTGEHAGRGIRRSRIRTPHDPIEQEPLHV